MDALIDHHLRRISESISDVEFVKNVADLKSSVEWSNSTKLRNWIGKKWLPEAKVVLYLKLALCTLLPFHCTGIFYLKLFLFQRWVYAFRRNRFLIGVKTNNGVESINSDFKKKFLETPIGKANRTLVRMVNILIHKFIPEKYDR